MPKPYKVKDKYFLRAKEEGYRARSAYKLQEIQEKFRIIRTGDYVLDLGAAPGSFLQFIAKIIGQNGKAVGIDLQEIEAVAPNVFLLQEDIFNVEKISVFLSLLNISKFDVVTSDLAPKTTGIRDLDQGLSAELTEEAWKLAEKFLKPGGHFVAKVFEGGDLPYLLKKMKSHFSKVSLYKPNATRDRSFETYIVALNFKPVKIGS